MLGGVPANSHPTLSPPHHLVAHPCLQALIKGPLAITIWADANPDIQLYSTGIYEPPASKTAKEDHAVTLVGYGTETLKDGKAADYWIIKNRQAHGCWVAGRLAGWLAGWLAVFIG